MRFYRLVRPAVSICACAVVSACGMADRPAPRKLSRRLLVRAVAICGCLAVVAYGMVAAPAAPAHAAVANGVRVLAPADTPVTVSYPGGDLVASIDDGGVDPAAMSQYISTNLPQAVGLEPGASLSDLLQATYNKMRDVAWVPSSEPPPTFSGGSMSVSGSTVTVDIPAASVQEIQTAAASEPPNALSSGQGASACMSARRPATPRWTCRTATARSPSTSG